MRATLTSDHLRRLHRALVDAFDRDGIKDLLQSFSFPLDVFSADGANSWPLFDVISYASRAGWILELVRAAYRAQPQNAELAALASELGLTPGVAVQAAGTADPVAWTAAVARRPGAKLPVDMATWRLQIPAVGARVCRVEVSGQSVGTGFLVGPDVVLTCRHVVEDALTRPATIRCRFDYRVLLNGQTEGWAAELHPSAPVVADSPAPLGRSGGLDCLLLRLQRAAGSEPVTAGAGVDPTQARGWLRLPEKEPPRPRGRALVVAQNVTAGALQVLLGLKVIARQDKTRYYHQLAADPMASGSPCFDLDWNLVAVHLIAHAAGGQDSGAAVRVGAIQQWLKKAGATPALGDPLTYTAANLLSSPADAGPIRSLYDQVVGRPLPPPAPGSIKHEDDPQKDRWGGQSERAGRKLSAEITDTSKRLFTSDFVVASTDGSPLEGPVVFHLHDSFPRMVIHIRRMQDGVRAVLGEVVAYGAFTVGAQVKDRSGRWIGLELDLAEDANLPQRFRER